MDLSIEKIDLVVFNKKNNPIGSYILEVAGLKATRDTNRF